MLEATEHVHLPGGLLLPVVAMSCTARQVQLVNVKVRMFDKAPGFVSCQPDCCNKRQSNIPQNPPFRTQQVHLTLYIATGHSVQLHRYQAAPQTQAHPPHPVATNTVVHGRSAMLAERPGAAMQ